MVNSCWNGSCLDIFSHWSVWNVKKNITLDILTMSFIFGHFVHGPFSSSSQSQSFFLRSHRVCEVPWRSRPERETYNSKSRSMSKHIGTLFTTKILNWQWSKDIAKVKALSVEIWLTRFQCKKRVLWRVYELTLQISSWSVLMQNSLLSKKVFNAK